LARTTIVQLTDDIDGSAAAETVSFAVDGRSYEIDLSTEHANALRDNLAPFVAAARRAGRVDASSRRGQRRHERPDRADSRAVRAWANQNGVAVSPRGRIPETVLAQFTSAQQAPVAQPAPAEPAPAESAAEPVPTTSKTTDLVPAESVAAAEPTPAEAVPAEPGPAESGDKPKRSRRKRG